MFMPFLTFSLVIILAYLIGSFPTAFLIARLRGINIFEVGSGNMGGTNIARSLGLHWGILTVVIDIIKGIIAIMVARWLVPVPNALYSAEVLAAIAVVVGHNYSIFASLIYSYYRKRWRLMGGKGASTAFGTFIVLLSGSTFLLILAVFLAVTMYTRYVSLAVLLSLITGVLTVTILVLRGIEPSVYLVYGSAMLAMMLWRFQENIFRLATGTERRLGERVVT